MRTIRKTDHLAWRTIAGQSFIVDSRNSVLHELDGVGTFIWKLIDGDVAPEHLVRRVTETYEVSGEQAGADMEVFLKELLVKGLIEYRATS